MFQIGSGHGQAIATFLLYWNIVVQEINLTDQRLFIFDLKKHPFTGLDYGLLRL